MDKLPRFARGESLKVFKNLPKEEKDLINDYVKYVAISSKSKQRLDNNKRSLITFRKSIRKPLKETNLQDLRNFLMLLNSSDRTQSSRNEIKHTIKRFLKWKFKDWSKRFEELKDIKLVMKMNEEKINAGTLLKPEEINKIMKQETRFRWKTFFITLYESGLRPIELRTLRWKDVKLSIEGSLTEINIYATKTSKARSVYVKEATKYLREWKERQERQGVKNDLIFPAKKNPDVPIGKSIVSEWLRDISKKVLGREVNPYLLRHTRATELYVNSGIPDKTAQKFLGHSKSMGDVYTHLSNKDVKEAVANAIYDTEDIPKGKKEEFEKRIAELEKKLEPHNRREKEEKEWIKEQALEYVKELNLKRRKK